MRKIKNIVIAATAGLVLVAGQAIASAQSPVADRVGEEKDRDEHVLVPLALLGLAALIVVSAGSSSSDDAPESA